MRSKGLGNMGEKQLIYEQLKNLKDLDIDVTIDNYNLDKARIHINLLHEHDEGFITLSVKNKQNEWVPYHYTVADLRDNIHKALSLQDMNIYISVNSFFNPVIGRNNHNIKSINALYSDIDYYNIKKLKDLSFDEMLYILDRDYFDKTLPMPNFIIHTGQGLALYWLIEPVKDFKMALWNSMQRYILEQVSRLGADTGCIDCARVLRLAGSTNQKNNKKTDIVIYEANNKYDLIQLQRKYLPELTDYVKNINHKKKGRKAKVVKLYTLLMLHETRLKDLITLVEFRVGMCRNAKGELTTTGQREFIIFLYRYWSCCYTSDTEQALENAKSFNKMFKEPLKLSEVVSNTRSADKAYQEWLKNSPNGVYDRGGYNYKNDTLITKLNITKEEMQLLLTIIDDTEVKRRMNIRTNEAHKAIRRNEEGLTKRELKKLDNINKVNELKLQGLNNTQIAKLSGLSVRHVRRLVNERY